VEKKYQSEQLMVIHDMAKSLYKIGAIDNTKMREFDTDCLVSIPETVKETTESTEMEHISPIPSEI
jgi:DNA-binding transcriptional regulator YiaG